MNEMAEICVKGVCQAAADTAQVADAETFPANVADSAAQFDVWDELLSMLPDNLMDWLALIVLSCAVLAALLPPPPKKAPGFCHASYRLICALGLGASRLRGRSARAAAKLGSLFRRKK